MSKGRQFWLRREWSAPLNWAGPLLTAAVLLSACKREERGFRVAPPSAEAAHGIEVSSLRVAHHRPPQPVKNQYEENAYAISEGQHLYEAFNCVGCHAHGGGDKGPALMDDRWIYGSNPEQIHATIIEGRPNGMPSYREKIPDYQVWQIVAYVRSLGGLTPKDAVSGRSDAMQTGKPPNSTDKVQPKNTTEPRPE